MADIRFYLAIGGRYLLLYFSRKVHSKARVLVRLRKHLSYMSLVRTDIHFVDDHRRVVQIQRPRLYFIIRVRKCNAYSRLVAYLFLFLTSARMFFISIRFDFLITCLAPRDRLCSVFLSGCSAYFDFGARGIRVF